MDKKKLFNTIIEVLDIPSPTFKEKKISQFLEKNYFSSKAFRILRAGDSFIATLSGKSNLPHLALVGHLDVVPEFHPARRSRGRIYGAGASDMKASLGIFLYLLKNHSEILRGGYRISFIFYAKEEGTSLEQNGLHDLIKKFPTWFKTVDMALVGEPTDNTVQVGCCGSIHARVRIPGRSCHSARPWQGENALYKALPFLNKMSRVRPRSYRIGKGQGVVFRDVWQVTVGKTEGGTTTVPGEWNGNVNYRFAPRMNKREALSHFKKFLIAQGLPSREFEIYSFSPGGKMVETPLYHRTLRYLRKQGMGMEAKQAWTDVAQFGTLGIPSFNCGPGLTAKCHSDDEYVLEEDILRYTKIWLGWLTGKDALSG